MYCKGKILVLITVWAVGDNLTKSWEVTCDGLVSRPVTIGTDVLNGSGLVKLWLIKRKTNL